MALKSELLTYNWDFLLVLIRVLDPFRIFLNFSLFTPFQHFSTNTCFLFYKHTEAQIFQKAKHISEPHFCILTVEIY